MGDKTMEKETIREFLLRGEKEEDFVIKDISTHGCSGGVISELIYYWDINKFYDKHNEEIWDEINEIGGLTELIKEKDAKLQPACDSHFKCFLTWCAVECVACKILNEREQKKSA